MRKLFNCKVYKVSIDGGFSCPNRDGKKGFGGCIFCDETGSSARTQNQTLSIKEQTLKNIEFRKTRYKAKKFIVYFQSFSNTYEKTDLLEKKYLEAIKAHKDIVGISISTRADCIDEEKIKLIASLKKIVPYVNIEYGMQTSHNKTLEKLNRKETFEDFLYALEITKKYGINHCAHIILGLIDETYKDQLKTADKLANLKVQGVKIHLLVAMKNTLLQKMYENKSWKPLSFDEYISLSCSFLERLHKDCIIHRISSSGHLKHLVAPKWMIEKKLKIIPAILEEFLSRKTTQGFHCKYPK